MLFIWGQSGSHTVQKMKFSIKYFFSKCDEIRSFLSVKLHFLYSANTILPQLFSQVLVKFEHLKKI